MPLIVCHPDFPDGETQAMGQRLILFRPSLRRPPRQRTTRFRYPDLKGYDPLPTLSGRKSSRDQTGILIYNSFMSTSDADIVVEDIRKLITGEIQSADSLAEHGLRVRGLIRAIHTGRYKFARYLQRRAHCPTDWHMLTTHTDLELYD